MDNIINEFIKENVKQEEKIIKENIEQGHKYIAIKHEFTYEGNNTAKCTCKYQGFNSIIGLEDLEKRGYKIFDLTKIIECLKAIKIGFDYYGLNGFFEMHKDVCENPNNPWTHDLEILNNLNINEFESLCSIYLNY